METVLTLPTFWKGRITAKQAIILAKTEARTSHRSILCAPSRKNASESVAFVAAAVTIQTNLNITRGGKRAWFFKILMEGV